MSPEEKAKLVRDYERLRELARELSAQANSFGESLAGLPASQAEIARNHATVPEGLPAIMEAMIPSIREAIRGKLKAIRQLDEEWYEPKEVEELSGGKVKADTIRNWVNWGQIDGESNGRQVRVYKHSVEQLRKNKWRALREPDTSKLPPSKRARIRPEGA